MALPLCLQNGAFWLYNWFQADSSNNMMYIYFLMNGNIYGYSLALVPYSLSWCPNGECYAIPPNPPASTITGEPIFVQSYINAYNTAFNQETSSFNGNYQKALYRYVRFTSSEVNSNTFVPGTFGSREQYNSLSQSQPSFIVHHLQDIESVYNNGNPYLFISADSGGGSGFMYLDWIIVTYGVPYVVNVS